MRLPSIPGFKTESSPSQTERLNYLSAYVLELNRGFEALHTYGYQSDPAAITAALQQAHQAAPQPTIVEVAAPELQPTQPSTRPDGPVDVQPTAQSETSDALTIARQAVEQAGATYPNAFMKSTTEVPRDLAA